MPIPNKHWSEYPRVTWRSTAPVLFDGELGFSLQTEDGSVLRFRIPALSAKHLAESFAEALQRGDSRKNEGDA